MESVPEKGRVNSEEGLRLLGVDLSDSSMAFFLNRTTIAAHFQGSRDDAFAHSRRQFHIAPGPREQALLAEDPALKRFKSHKKSVKLVKKVGNVLTVVVAAGCFYEIYVRAMAREETQK